MSWEEETKPLSQEEQLELIAQAIDKFALDYEAQQAEVTQARKKLTKTIEQLNTLERQHEAKIAYDKQWLDEQKAQVETLQNELRQCIQETEKHTLRIKKWLEIGLYGVLMVVLYQALTTSLWHTLGFETLYYHLQKQFQYGGLLVTSVYTLLNIGALSWLVRKLTKTWRY
ncbi:hypothetical protein ACK4CS_18470 [Enterococcus gallinarum]|uniref:Uncharacterized protein n=1 Tax=Enterococcus gallinarum TaxID=1353 RepID=A0AAE4HW74_ENTGA|nr:MULTISPECIES: hypothetical protein [Bacteria]MDK4348322.1 hypothetical protein [Enterococcus faecium]MDK4387144.1 hypothetical protein [Enterococcus faecium]MDT2066769.1 hypothetical protein [Enterococcus faecalis]MDT2096179.1 hypothetical protein [Enterococcus faecalis]MDT2383277.1 hypothetical protein [Enterococcus avium]